MRAKKELRFGGADLVRIVCKQCELEDTCPSVLMDEYDAGRPGEDEVSTAAGGGEA